MPGKSSEEADSDAASRGAQRPPDITNLPAALTEGRDGVGGKQNRRGRGAMWEGAQSGGSYRASWRGKVCDSRQGRSEHDAPPTSRPAQSAPSNVESVRARLATIEAGLQPWHAHGCLDPDTAQDSESDRRLRGTYML